MLDFINIQHKNFINIGKNKEHWKRNLFPDISKENSYNNENDLSGNINIARKKLFDLNKKKRSSKRSNSIDPSIINHNNDKSEKKEIKIKRNDKLNLIIMRKFKKHYFIIWNKKKNVGNNKNNCKNDRKNRNNDVEIKKKKIII